MDKAKSHWYLFGPSNLKTVVKILRLINKKVNCTQNYALLCMKIAWQNINRTV